jgi:hypothetical protein
MAKPEDGFVMRALTQKEARTKDASAAIEAALKSFKESAEESRKPIPIAMDLILMIVGTLVLDEAEKHGWRYEPSTAPAEKVPA